MLNGLQDHAGWGRQHTYGESRAGRAAQTYHRVPTVLYTESLAFGAVTGIGNATLTRTQDLRNDSQYVMEIDAVGFSLQDAFAGIADESLSQIGISLSDLNREIAFFQRSTSTDSNITVPGTELFVRPSCLVDLASNFFQGLPGPGDVLQWSGTKWNLRFPLLLPPGGTIGCRAFSYVARAQVISIALIGSLLVPNLGPLGDAAEALGQPWQVPPSYRDDILGYEWVPYVLYSEESGTAGGTDFPQMDLRNMSPYDMVIYEAAFYSSLLNSSSPSSATLPSIRIVDSARNVPWMKDFQPIQRFFPGMTNRNAVANQSSQWFMTKWDLGAGTILPAGEKVRATVQQASSGVLGLAFIGALQRPVREGTVYADAWRKHLSAVPAMAW